VSLLSAVSTCTGRLYLSIGSQDGTICRLELFRFKTTYQSYRDKDMGHTGGEY
jgi:hypothetical protein